MINWDNVVVKVENYEKIKKENDGKLFWQEGTMAFCLVERRNGTCIYATENDLQESGMTMAQVQMNAIFKTNEKKQVPRYSMREENLVLCKGNEFEISQVLLNIDTTMEDAVRDGMIDTGTVIVMPITDREIQMYFDYNGFDIGYVAIMRDFQKKTQGKKMFDLPIKYVKNASNSFAIYEVEELDLETGEDILYQNAIMAMEENNFEFAITLLETIIQMSKELDEKDLSGIYVTLSTAYLNRGDMKNPKKALVENGKIAEQYLKKALELNPQNKVAPKSLVQAYVSQLDAIKVCETIAKYNVDIAENPSRSIWSEKMQLEDKMASELFANMIQNFLIKYIKENKDKFEILFEIHEKYLMSDKYTMFLIQCALVSGNYYRLSILYQDLLRSIKKDSISESEYFQILINKLYAMTRIGGKVEVQNSLAEVEDMYKSFEGKMSFEIEHSYYSNKSAALLNLGESMKLLELFTKIDSKFYDNTILYNIAQAYLKNENYEEAVRIGWSASVFKEDELDSVLLGKAYMGMGEYTKAIELLKKAIRYIYTAKEEYEFNGRMYDSISLDTKDRKLMKVYPSLIQAYIGDEQYVKAKATYLEMQDMVNESEKDIDITLILGIEEKLIGKEEVVQTEYRKIKAELEKSNREVSVLKSNAEGWYKKLLKCQYGDKDVEISDEIWDNDISAGMIDVIDAITALCIKPRSKEYRQILHKVEYRFPNLKGKAKDFLVTAEQIYYTFKKDEMMDFAPVMVEYSRAIEAMLWNYFEHSDDYRKLAEKQKQYRGQGATMGAAVHTIAAAGKPLYPYYKKLEEIRIIRNNCAHVNVRKEPDVKELHDYIWESDLVDKLCSF